MQMPTGAEPQFGGHAAALAKSAREKLAQALAELQDEGAPEVCLSNAGGVAQAMGLLLTYEQRRDACFVQDALDVVRNTLGSLQSVGERHPALTSATGKVAASLGLLHSVGELANVGRDKRSDRPTRTHHLHGTPQPCADTTDTVKTRSRRRPGSPSLERRVQPWEKVRAPEIPSTGARGKAKRRSNPPPQKRAVIEAALGTHSHTNFYRGLSDDIFESGGLFVATYEVPRRGERVMLKVNMPGGYEFEAEGVVQWTRELRSDGSDPPEVSPGFGVRFTRLTSDARRLVERYVRNREPIFHD